MSALHQPKTDAEWAIWYTGYIEAQIDCIRIIDERIAGRTGMYELLQVKAGVKLLPQPYKSKLSIDGLDKLHAALKDLTE